MKNLDEALVSIVKEVQNKVLDEMSNDVELSSFDVKNMTPLILITVYLQLLKEYKKND